MNDAPLVSVVMTTFNEPPLFIIQAIQSIIDQTLPDFELLLIDDSTNADTIKAIDALAAMDPRMTVIREPRRIGFVRALNLGLKRARGTYIARMDGDDISLPGRFAAQVKYLGEYPGVAVVGGAIDIINAAGQVTGHRNYPSTSLMTKIFSLIRSPLAHPAVMMRKSLVEKGFYYDETFPRAEDFELWLRLLKYGYNLANLPETVLLFRVVENLSLKRNGEHFYYNYQARKKNLSWHNPLWGCLSMLIARIYILLPKKIFHMVYKQENNIL